MDETPPPEPVEPTPVHRSVREALAFLGGFALAVGLLGALALFLGASFAFDVGARNTVRGWALLYLSTSLGLLLGVLVTWRQRRRASTLRPFEAGLLVGIALVALLASACGGCVAWTGPSRLGG